MVLLNLPADLEAILKKRAELAGLDTDAVKNGLKQLCDQGVNVDEANAALLLLVKAIEREVSSIG